MDKYKKKCYATYLTNFYKSYCIYNNITTYDEACVLRACILPFA